MHPANARTVVAVTVSDRLSIKEPSLKLSTFVYAGATLLLLAAAIGWAATGAWGIAAIAAGLTIASAGA